MGTMESFFGEYHELKEAKALLDTILRHYDIYSGQFNEIDTEHKFPPDKFVEAYGTDAFSDKYKNYFTDEASVLRDRIRAYRQFDDSE